MNNYIVCYSGDTGIEVPKEILNNCNIKIDLVADKKRFSKVIKEFSISYPEVKFYVASRRNFYHIFETLIRTGIAYDRIIKPEPLTKRISISGRDYIMREEFLTNPSKPINKAIAKENLLLFKLVIEKTSLKFFLAYGTLLGAIREGDFIVHDSDIDIGMYFNDKDNFLSLLFDLKEVGLELVRFKNNLLSLMRHGEYIDIYFFEKKFLPKFGWYCGGLFIPSKFLNQLESYQFHQNSFSVPNYPVDFLVYCYGRDWQTPVRNKHAKPLFSITSFVLKLLPLSLKNLIRKYFNL
jgi:lipopolysaccharide cholinephosphotransferase